jgi:hypothetical protein
MQFIKYALRLAAASAGSKIAAKMAMMAMTTSSSISVKAARRLTLWSVFLEKQFKFFTA